MARTMTTGTHCEECQAEWPALPARPLVRNGCKGCRREYKRRWEKYNKIARRGYNRKHYLKNAPDLRAGSLHRYHVEDKRFKKYGISREQFNCMLEEQERECAICSREISESAHIDHDHATGTVRGLLCPSCNRALGYFGDSKLTIERALDYLLRKEVV